MKHSHILITLVISLLWGSTASAQIDPGGKALLVEPKASQKWALLIGVDDYNYVNDLNFCGNDIKALQKQFVAAGFPKDHVTLMHEQAKQHRYQPYKSNIENELELLLGELDESGTKIIRRGLIEKGDLVIIAFSGHGIHPAGGSQSYFCPIDAKLNKPNSMVALAKIYKLLEISPANIKLLIVDACRNDPHPGGKKAMKAIAETKGFAKTLDNPPEGIMVLSSCAPGQVSWEDKDIKHGVFMKYILEGLRGAADSQAGNRNNKVSLLELCAYTFDKTKTYVARTRGVAQTPSLKGNITGDFEFGLLTSLSPSPVPVSAPAPAMRPASSQPPPLLLAPLSKQQATAKQSAWAKHLNRKVIETNKLGIKMVLVPPGEFTMGSPESEDGSGDDEHPQHQVQITKPFYLASTEVTQQQWQAVMGTTPWKGGSYSKEGDDYAATFLNWGDAQEYVEKLSHQEKITYRLPTEAEWEYACRAGSESMCCFGESAETLKDYAWFDGNAYDVDENDVHGVGLKLPNSFGLFDLHGNVWEWCSDRYDEGSYGTLAGKTTRNPTGPSAGSFRVLRGGAGLLSPEYVRSANRVRYSPTFRYYNIGFRVVCVIE